MLRDGPRRRTPGLRREEVAQAAGIGASWYTWLEQGRDIKVSVETLRRISKALKLDRHEIQHVFRLAGLGLPVQPDVLPSSVAAPLQRLLDAMRDIPAYIHNARWDRIAWNDASLALMGDYSKDTLQERNTVWRTFLNPAVRAYSEDWEHLARIVVSEFTTSFGGQFEDPWLWEFVEALSARSPQFEQLWNDRDVIPRHEERTRIHHKAAGRLYLERSTLQVSSTDRLTMVVFVPLETEDTPERLRRLVTEFESRKI